MATTAQDVKALKQEIAALKDQLAEQIETQEVLQSKGSFPHYQDLQQLASQAGQSVRTYLTDKQEQIGHAKEHCEKTIQRRPFTSTALAFAGGVLLTSLLKKRS